MKDFIGLSVQELLKDITEMRSFMKSEDYQQMLWNSRIRAKLKNRIHSLRMDLLHLTKEMYK